MEAAKSRKSVAEVVRTRLTKKKKTQSRANYWKRLDKFAHEMSLMNPGISGSQKLIEMRYEQ